MGLWSVGPQPLHCDIEIARSPDESPLVQMTGRLFSVIQFCILTPSVVAHIPSKYAMKYSSDSGNQQLPDHSTSK